MKNRQINRLLGVKGYRWNESAWIVSCMVDYIPSAKHPYSLIPLRRRELYQEGDIWVKKVRRSIVDEKWWLYLTPDDYKYLTISEIAKLKVEYVDFDPMWLNA
jgi:hypothetical protein